MAKKNVIIGDCRMCKNAGEENNFMCFCSAYKVNRTIGTRVCSLFLKK